MKNIRLFGMMLLFTSCSKIMVQHAESTAGSLQSRLFFALPANTIEFTIKIREEKYEMGQVLKNAECLKYLSKTKTNLGLDINVLNMFVKKNADYSFFSIIKDEIEWSEGAIPDTSKIFVFQNRGKWYKDNAFGLTYNDDWIVKDGVTSTENKSYEIVTSLASTVGSIVSSFVKSGNESLQIIDNKDCLSKLKTLIKLKDAYENFQLYPPSNVNAEALVMIRNAKVKQIEKEFEKLLYKKTEETKTHKFSLYISDVFRKGDKVNIFSVDQSNGNLLINSHIYNDIIWPVDSKKILSVNLDIDDSIVFTLSAMEDERTVFFKMKSSSFTTVKNKVNYGLTYNVPSIRTFYLRDENGNIVKEQRFPIAQFGAINTLNQKLTRADFTLDPLTGSLVKVNLESKAALTSEKIKTGGALLSQADSLFRKPKPTMIKKLEDEVKELELRVKKKEAESKLN